jgi:hypothetical protein
VGPVAEALENEPLSPRPSKTGPLAEALKNDPAAKCFSPPNPSSTRVTYSVLRWPSGGDTGLIIILQRVASPILGVTPMVRRLALLGDADGVVGSGRLSTALRPLASVMTGGLLWRPRCHASRSAVLVQSMVASVSMKCAARQRPRGPSRRPTVRSAGDRPSSRGPRWIRCARRHWARRGGSCRSFSSEAHKAQRPSLTNSGSSRPRSRP